ncbi:MAG TPA: tetratricopeptide repeat protein [Gemmatales bacterium]|nr:tetratricopeptide repeat protein [Gemmatales bacterium]HMP58957.1 tetratricopeptide repeat protein [Gemmatales bacterium]
MRRFTSVALGLSLLSASVGCIREFSTHSNGLTEGRTASEKPFVKPGPNWKPKPDTVVAFAELRLSVADTAQRSIDRLSAAMPAAVENERVRLEQQRQQALRIQQESWREARKLYEQALELSPNYVPAILGLARLHEKQGSFPLAIEQYLKALDQNPQTGQVWFELGMCYGKTKQWDHAVAALKRACELEPTDSAMATHYGWCLARCEKYEESWTVFRRHVGDALAYYRLALMAKHLGKVELSKQYLTVAIQVEPQCLEAHALLAALEQAQITNDSEGGAVVPAGFMAPAGTPIPQVQD